jgi:hypothetical protein
MTCCLYCVACNAVCTVCSVHGNGMGGVIVSRNLFLYFFEVECNYQ